MIDMESGTLDLNAEGIYCGIGLAAFGTDGTDLPAGTGEDWLHSLKMSGGSLTAKGTGDSTENPPAAMKDIIGVGTGISASRAISALGGSINAIGRGANRAFGINLFSGFVHHQSDEHSGSPQCQR